jgi:NADH-quinone oxidoreductase subunit K
MNSILSLSFFFILSALIVLLLKPNFLFVLFSLEIILLGININFILASFLLDEFFGQFITLILFSVAALDTSIGLIILLNYYNLHQVIQIKNLIKG